jgi:hypothetical protein
VRDDSGGILTFPGEYELFGKEVVSREQNDFANLTMPSPEKVS